MLINLKEQLEQLEVFYIKLAMYESNNVVAEAARQLRMKRTTLVERLRKYKLHIYSDWGDRNE